MIRKEAGKEGEENEEGNKEEEEAGDDEMSRKEVYVEGKLKKE